MSRPRDPVDPTAAVLDAVADGRMPAPIALMRLVLDGPDDVALLARLDRAVEGRPALTGLRDLARLVATVRHGGDPQAAVQRWADRFDAAARISPEASVALYALGDPVRLAAHADAVADLLAARGLIGPARRVVDVGCGIGRMEVALAGRVATVTGLDPAPAMVAEAVRRTAGLRGVTIRQGDGRTLAGIAYGAVDLVLLVDVMPYLVEAGAAVVASLFAEIARVLAPGGDAVVLNWSYRGDPDRDRAEGEANARAGGLSVISAGDRPFADWDGVLFHFRRADSK